MAIQPHAVAEEDGRLPDVSPLYADVRGACSALFSVGTKDALLGNTVFLHARWRWGVKLS